MKLDSVPHANEDAADRAAPVGSAVAAGRGTCEFRCPDGDTRRENVTRRWCRDTATERGCVDPIAHGPREAEGLTTASRFP